MSRRAVFASIRSPCVTLRARTYPDMGGVQGEVPRCLPGLGEVVDLPRRQVQEKQASAGALEELVRPLHGLRRHPLPQGIPGP